MAIELLVSVKNKMLNDAFNTSWATYYLSIPNILGAPYNITLPNQEIRFKDAALGRIELAAPVQFAVPQGVLIDRIYISTGPVREDGVGNLSDRITLQGDEIGDFTTGAGIYLVSSIIINMQEVS